MQVLFREVVHISPTQPGKGAEDEKVMHQFVTFFLERAVDEQGYFFLRKKTTFRFLFGDVVGIGRGVWQPAVVDGGIDDAAEGHHV